MGTVAVDEEEITPNAVAVAVVKVVKDDERLVADTVAPPPATKVTKPTEPGLSFLVQRLLLPTLLSIVQGFTKGLFASWASSDLNILAGKVPEDNPQG